MIRKVRGKGQDESLSAFEKISASTVGGALATWNQPIEVVRVEVGDLFYVPPLIPLVMHSRCNPWLKALQMQTGPRNSQF
jgi:uncharacterized RmlC-like cupin family protein